MFCLKDKYPINTESEVRTASKYFDQYYNVMDVRDRVEYCTNLLKKAEELEIVIGSDNIHRHANVFNDNYRSSEFFFNKCINERKLAIGNQNLIKIAGSTYDICKIYDGVIELKKAGAPNKVLFEAILAADERSNVKIAYGQQVPSPVETISGVQKYDKRSLKKEFVNNAKKYKDIGFNDEAAKTLSKEEIINS